MCNGAPGGGLSVLQTLADLSQGGLTSRPDGPSTSVHGPEAELFFHLPGGRLFPTAASKLLSHY